MNLSFKPLANPILLVNDCPEGLGGLARVGRDLAGLLCTLPQFRVGYLGMGGFGRRRFSWAQYHFPESPNFGLDYIAPVWSDFAGSEPGIILTLWDASRVLGIGQPNSLPAELANFMGPGRTFRKWGYFPVDSTGPSERGLAVGSAAAVAGYDRVLAASEWGRDVLAHSGRSDADWIPHMIWTDKFKRHANARNLLGLAEGDIILGVNMANQARKDWPVAFECAQILREEYGNRFKLWAHTDVLVRYWSLYALAADYNLQDCLTVTLDQTDDQLALRYSACDCTILPSAGEGFGLTIAESMACGVPCVVTDYAAGQELVPESWRVPPVAYRIDTLHNCKRAILSGWGFAARAKEQIELGREDPERAALTRESVLHLDGNLLKTVWTKWMLEGLR